jgi:putative transcriptional regulator
MPKKAPEKKTTFGADLIEEMRLVLAHQRGKIELEQVSPKPIAVKAIRKRVKMSQAEFARAYGISKRALQEWEQGGGQPDSAARAVPDRHCERAGHRAPGPGERITTDASHLRWPCRCGIISVCGSSSYGSLARSRLISPHFTFNEG